MRIFSALALTLILAFSVAGCTGSKVAVVDPARLFQESTPGKAGIEHLKQIETAMQAQLEVAQGLIEKAPND
ncbi:MAG: OmpH family outer membrane protein, partial [Bilophila sp.]